MKKILLRSPKQLRQQNSALNKCKASKRNSLGFTMKRLFCFSSIKYTILTLIFFIQMTGSMLADPLFYIEPVNSVYVNQTTCTPNVPNYTICQGSLIDINIFYNSNTFNGTLSLVAVNNATLVQTIFGSNYIIGSGSYNPSNDNTPPVFGSCNYFKTFSIQLPTGSYTFIGMKNNDPSSMSLNNYNFTLNVVNSTAVIAEPQTYCSNNICFGLTSPVAGAEGYSGTVNFGDGTGDIDWSAADGNSLFCQCMNHTYNYSGPYPHTFTISGLSVNACGFTNFSTTCTILNAPTISSATVCPGSTNSVTLNATPNNLPSANYVWKKGSVIVQNGGNSLTVNSPFNSTQTYTCTFTDNTNSCSGTATGTISIAQNPNFTISGDNSTCAGTTLNYQLDNYSLGNTATWSITPNNAGSFQGNVSTGDHVSIDWTNIPSTGATIEVNYTYGNGCIGSTTLHVDDCCPKPIQSSILYNCYGTQASPFYSSQLPTTLSPIGAQNKLVIDGIFIVNNNFTLNNVMVELGPDAVIRVNQNAVLSVTNNTIMRARCEMWQGIVATNSSASPFQTPPQVVINGNSIIQDAIVALDVQDNSRFEIEHAIFNRNHIALSVSNFAYTQAANGYIRSSEITCMNPSSMSTQDVLIGTTGGQFLGERSYAGISTFNVSAFTIGDNTTNANVNLMHYLDYGVIAENSTLTMFNNQIYNLLPNLTTSQQMSDCPIGTAVCDRGWNGTNNMLTIGKQPQNGLINQNIFHDVQNGVDVKLNVNAKIEGNMMYNVDGDAIRVLDYTYAASNSNTMSIYQNSFKEIGNYVVYLNNNRFVPKTITGNVVNMQVMPTGQNGQPQLNHKNCLGIKVCENAENSTYQNININNNN
jgi:hypothetical protein